MLEFMRNLYLRMGQVSLMMSMESTAKKQLLLGLADTASMMTLLMLVMLSNSTLASSHLVVVLFCFHRTMSSVFGLYDPSFTSSPVPPVM